MSERSEPKQVSRRNALAFLGYAAAFGLVASSAILTVSQAEAQTTTTPTTPTTPPADAAKSGTERRQERRSGRTERRQERRTGRAERRQERRTGRDERRDARDGTTHHRAKKVIGRSGQQRQSARLSAGRRKAVQRAASAGPQDTGQAAPARRRGRAPRSAGPSRVARTNEPCRR